ncbi:restriction endonuclease [Acidocella sp.]|uniref:restriction endonuclease n=1 Tax=Acidocella sp. TaxID=50710 RepID=UPI00262D7E87|nr:restriction endonuclease [Acidocella sp.]
MAIPDYQSLMLPVLKEAAVGEVRIGEVVARLADHLQLTSDERVILLPSGKQTLFANRVHWAKTYLAKAMLVESTRRGYFQITPRGKEVLTANPWQIDNNFLNQFEEFRSFRERTVEYFPGATEDASSEPKPVQGANATPDEVMRAAHRQIESALAQDLLDRILSSPPDFFERLIVSLLLGMGFGGTATAAGRALGRSGDGGVDGVIDQDALGLDRIYIQAKRYGPDNKVSSGAIRDFFGSLDRHKASKGLFVTTSSFSSSARETAEFLSKRIVLIDGVQLTNLMIRYNIGCRVEETLYFKKIDEEFFE